MPTIVDAGQNLKTLKHCSCSALLHRRKAEGGKNTRFWSLISISSSQQQSAALYTKHGATTCSPLLRNGPPEQAVKSCRVAHITAKKLAPTFSSALCLMSCLCDVPRVTIQVFLGRGWVESGRRHGSRRPTAGRRRIDNQPGYFVARFFQGSEGWNGLGHIKSARGASRWRERLELSKSCPVNCLFWAANGLPSPGRPVDSSSWHAAAINCNCNCNRHHLTHALGCSRSDGYGHGHERCRSAHPSSVVTRRSCGIRTGGPWHVCY
ncbi:hypothetical protein B0T19DRAFT_237218 [Cercophora scortea]|uniref:Uncharacterized protein n=1 Tax=Cercophora scortea TaxID=314031 RepID=A0AAE0M9V2_9PEZI|nr:hypothetical protein B0T19DRAFT_237218 [Cercophora scortea]